MAEIGEYDLRQIFEEAILAQEYSEIVHDWAEDDSDGNGGYGEGEFCGIVRNTVTGSYYSFSAWHDYTGWDCQGGVEWFGPHESVVGAANKLSQVDRRRLGFDHTPEHKGLYRD